eukprot:CAMPEP_0197889084 /NCGR_PEP_ID=MMETSP1439-20131203/23376_1 /TAXON_ID=66791 /ORGANISM="Gonyaulax spinifera, Strain CCMP409" /LENGTH=51 /DNA_ID=CAMNT_0043509037 /DNA_START=184 /DNA_END=339 /DNA_ORIENTATION=+
MVCSVEVMSFHFLRESGSHGVGFQFWGPFSGSIITSSSVPLSLTLIDSMPL